VYAGWNESIRRTTGKYIHVAASDDTAMPGFLEEMVIALESECDVDMAVCRFEFIDAEGKILQTPPRQRLDTLYDKWQEVPHRRPREADILIHLCIGIPWTTAGALLFRTSLLEKTGLFRTDCVADADRFWSLRASFYSDTISLPERLSTWRYHARQASVGHDVRWARRSLRVISETVDECLSLIPGAWRRDPAWRKKLLWKAVQDYLAEYHLDRRALRAAPGAFVTGCIRGLVKEPRYLLRRILSGFSWDVPEFVSEHDYLESIIKEWGVQWEPKPLN